jgi:hypothetical protein
VFDDKEASATVIPALGDGNCGSRAIVLGLVDGLIDMPMLPTGRYANPEDEALMTGTCLRERERARERARERERERERER